MPTPERFAVKFESSDVDKDAALIRLEQEPLTFEEARGACQSHGVRACLMRGDAVHGWVEADGGFTPGGPIR